MKDSISSCLANNFLEDMLRPSAVSIGDSENVQRAMRSLRASTWPDRRPLCKTLKLPNEPSLAALSETLRQLQPCLERMASSKHEFDVSIVKSAQLKVHSFGTR